LVYLLCAAAAAAAVLAGCAAAARDQRPGGRMLRLALPMRGGYAPEYTILCMEARGPEGARMVELMAKGLKNLRGLDPNLVRVERKGDTARLYYGRYRGVPDKRIDQFVPPPKAREDMRLIRNLASGTARPFLFATIVEIPPPDVGPPEWDLRNAPGVYTLQICYCIDKPGWPNRKEVAVAICKALREEGEEAWYWHGPKASVVTVGHFDESAIVRMPDGTIRYSDEVHALQNKREEFKYNTENGQIVYRIIGGRRIAAPSVLIEIPRNGSDQSK